MRCRGLGFGRAADAPQVCATSSRASTARVMSSGSRSRTIAGVPGSRASRRLPSNLPDASQSSRCLPEVARARTLPAVQHAPEAPPDAAAPRRPRRCARASAWPTAAAPSDSRRPCPRCRARCRARLRTPPLARRGSRPGTSPRPPTRPAARSDTMSPYRFGSSRTSNCSGRITRCMHAASTILSSYAMSGTAWRPRATDSRKSPSPSFMMFAL